MEDIFVEKYDAVGCRDVLAHGVVLGVDDHVLLALRGLHHLVEVAGLPIGTRPRQDEDRVLGKRIDDLDVALAREEEPRRDEDELVGRKTEFRAQPALLVRVVRQNRALERHDRQWEALALGLVAGEKLQPSLAARRVHDELSRKRAHQREDHAVPEEPVRESQADPRDAQHLERPGVPRTVVKRRGEPPVMVELLGLELVHRENDRQAPAPQRAERTDDGHVAEDPGFVLDEDHVGPTTDVAQLLVEVRSVEMTHADERHLMASLAQALADRARAVVAGAALHARGDAEAYRRACSFKPSKYLAGVMLWYTTALRAGSFATSETVSLPIEWCTSSRPSRETTRSRSFQSRTSARTSGFASHTKRSLRTPEDQNMRCSSNASFPIASPYATTGWNWCAK